MAPQPADNPICAHCGRVMPRQANKSGSPQPRKYCSKACRFTAGARLHGELEQAILKLLAERSPESTICPSEAARLRFGERFREHMEQTRRAARRLAHRGVVTLTQQGRAVKPEEIRGPIRIARGAEFSKALEEQA